MSTRYRLIELLADGRFRSGEWLGQQLGIGRAAVWKQVKALSDFGLDVHAVRGQGYRLSASFGPLKINEILAALSDQTVGRLDSVEVVKEIDSTNDYLKRTAGKQRSDHGRACIAEWQQAGRGRRGRQWVSPYGSSLYLSLAWRLDSALLQSGGLSLAMAVAVGQALESYGIAGLGLKWPNDIFFEGRKLAGILLDLSGESNGPFQVVIGVGVNCRLPPGAARNIDQPWADISQTGVSVDRNRLAGIILEKLVNAFDIFASDQLAGFRECWQRYDLIAGKRVELKLEHDTITGIARGIDSQGALMIEQGGVRKSFHAGEVSVRLV